MPLNAEPEKRDQFIQSVGGLVLQVIGPALVMVVAGSLGFFLVETIYGGPMIGRVKWIFGLFAFAAVLISRISIELGAERATLYGLLLAVATMVATGQLVQGNYLVLFAVLMFVWWCASRLTWDCTFIDDTRDATGQGMIDLAVARIQKFRTRHQGTEQTDANSQPPADIIPVTVDQESDVTPAAPPPTAWQSISRLFFHRRQPNTPGLWAFYFLIGALPLFGIGQLFLRMNDAAAHRAAAFHFFTYMVGILCLLMVTSLLGLHRYLARNNASIPVRVARQWMVFGVILAILILGFTFWLPRPMPQYSIANWFPKLTSRLLDPSEWSFGRDGQKKDDSNSNVNVGPTSRDDRSDPDQDTSGNSGTAKSGDSGESSGSQQEDSGNKSPDDGGKQSGGKHQDGKPESSGSSNQSGGKQSSKQSSKSGKKSEHRPESQAGQNEGDKTSSKDGSKSGDQADNQSGQKQNDGDQAAGKSDESKTADQKSSDDKSDDGKRDAIESPRETKRKKSQQRAEKRSTRGGQQRRQSPPPQQPPDDKKSSDKKSQEDSQSQSNSTGILSAIGSFLQTLFYFVMLAILLWFAWRYRSQLIPQLRSFLAEMAEFWRRLWGRKPKSRPVAKEESQRPLIRLPAFRDFQNPFATGMVQSWSPDEIVNYTFRAFEAWARDRDEPRDPEQTPHEFARLASRQDGSFAEQTRRLADLYCEVAYSKGSVSRERANTLSQLWDQLLRRAQQPVVATVR